MIREVEILNRTNESVHIEQHNENGKIVFTIRSKPSYVEQLEQDQSLIIKVESV